MLENKKCCLFWGELQYAVLAPILGNIKFHYRHIQCTHILCSDPSNVVIKHRIAILLMALMGRWSLFLSGCWQQSLHSSDASDVSNARVCLSYYWHSVVLRLPVVLSDCPVSASPTSSPLCCWRCFLFYWVTLQLEMAELLGIKAL